MIKPIYSKILTLTTCRNFNKYLECANQSRGGYKLAENVFLYDRQRKVGDSIHWQCEQRSICKARLFTKDSKIVRRSNDHIHEADENRISCYETKTRIKRKAEFTQDSTHQIVGNNFLKFHENEFHVNKFHEIEFHVNEFHEIEFHVNEFHEIEFHANEFHEIQFYYAQSI